jgi:hypothetical protein
LTADFKDLIVYEVVNMYPFEVEECTIGSGAPCGAIYLNQRFEALVQNRFERAGIDLRGDRRLAGLVQYFEISIKCQFNPFDPMATEIFEIPIGWQDNPLIGVRDGLLTLTR